MEFSSPNGSNMNCQMSMTVGVFFLNYLTQVMKETVK